MTLFRRRRPSEHESHALHVANARIEALNSQLSEAHETIRKQAWVIDEMKGLGREQHARIVNLRAQLAAAEGIKR